MLMHCISFAFLTMFHAFKCVFYMLEPYVLVGLDWADPMMIFLFFIHSHLFFPYSSTLCLMVLLCFSLSLSLSLLVVCAWHPSAKLLCPRTHFIPRHHLLIPLLSMSGSMMRRPVRTSQITSPNMTFIRNSTLSYRTSLILLF